MSITVRLFGPKHSGKTHFLWALQKFRDKDFDFVERSADMNRQGEEITAGRDPLDTAKRDEWVRFRWRSRGEELTVVSEPGEKFFTDAGGIDVPRLQQMFADDRTYLAAVVNPFLCNIDLATAALKEVIYTLHQREPSYTLAESVAIAARVLFHVPLDPPPPPADPNPPKVPVLALRTMGIGYDHVWLDKSKARVTIDPKTNAFGWEDAAGNEHLLEHLLKQLATQVVDLQWERYLIPLQKLVASAGRRAIVVLTHMDLLRYTVNITLDQFLGVLDELFDEQSDRFRSQEVLAGNRDIGIQKDVLNPVVHLNHVADGARQLWRAIKHRTAVGTGGASSAAAESDRMTGFDLIKAGVHGMLTAWPVLLVVLLLAAVPWFGLVRPWTQPGDIVRDTFTVMVCALPILFLAYLSWEWVRARYRPSAWQVRPPTVVFAQAPTGTVEVSIEAVRLHATLLGELLGRGWATYRDNHVRTYPAPELDRLRGGLGGPPVRRVWWPDVLLVLTVVTVITFGLIDLIRRAG